MAKRIIAALVVALLTLGCQAGTEADKLPVVEVDGVKTFPACLDEQVNNTRCANMWVTSEGQVLDDYLRGESVTVFCKRMGISEARCTIDSQTPFEKGKYRMPV